MEVLYKLICMPLAQVIPSLDNHRSPPPLDISHDDQYELYTHPEYSPELTRPHTNNLNPCLYHLAYVLSPVKQQLTEYWSLIYHHLQHMSHQYHIHCKYHHLNLTDTFVFHCSLLKCDL